MSQHKVLNDGGRGMDHWQDAVVEAFILETQHEIYQIEDDIRIYQLKLDNKKHALQSAKDELQERWEKKNQNHEA